MSDPLVPLGPWLVQLFAKIYFQPDHQLFSQAFDRHVSRNLAVRVNGRNLTYDEYRHIIEDARAKKYMSEQSNVDLLTSPTDPEGKGGAVAQHSRFTYKDKVTGHETSSSAVFIVTVEWIEERRVLTQLAEVME